MGLGNKIRILSKYNTFRLHDSFARCEAGKLKTVYNSSGFKEWVQRIEFYDSDLKQLIKLDLYGLKELTKVVSLNEMEFGDQFIDLCTLFKVDFKEQIKKHAFLWIENEERLATIALKQSADGMVYVTVFLIDSGDSRKAPILYIHGIWKTSPADLLINRLFQPA